MKKFAVLILAVASLTALAAPPHARSKHGSGGQYSAYATIESQKQGKFHGAGRSKSNRLPVVTFQIKSADRAKQGSHASMSMLIESMDAREFQRALAKNEVLTSVKLEVLRANREGTVTTVQEITLTNATVSKLNVKLKNGRELDDVSLTFQKVSYRRVIAKTMAQDDWKQ